ncbi:hypothetical protein FGG08_002325 [Glutinoglossum americanum]|uniref:Uncharacterized protein n=1 Tax=Glutinoglossum americanum TaxID=1670608 RepID=A0A9P8L4L4_9PEZI|nr:hypothetical protein FGG08_002325 [Glutinoglossum americanum]
MEAIHSLVARDISEEGGTGLSRTMVNLLIVLLVLVLCGLLLVAVLFFIRDHRRKQKSNEGLPVYSEKPANSPNHRRLTITATPYGGRPESFHVYSEKQQLIQGSLTPPLTPDSIPEIRITFPEEEDESGRRKSGRVVVVRVGETGVGLEPVEDNLPPYQRSDSDRFHSVDLERVGGLKEKI